MDGRLTSGSGPSSVHNKIDFVDLYPATAVPILVRANPQSPPPVLENRPFSLAVAVTNAPFPPNAPFAGFQPFFYQWYRDSGAGYVVVPNQTNATLSVTFAQLSDA